MDTPSEILAKCSKAVVENDFDGLMKKIGDQISSNAIAVAIAFAMTLVCLACTFYILSMAWDRIKSHLKTVASSKAYDPLESGRKDSKDYYTYRSMDGTRIPPPSEHAMLYHKMDRLKGKYSAYNRALSGYLVANNRVPDDIIDERVLVSSDDNFAYTPSR